MNRYKRPFPGSYDPNWRKITRLDSVHHQNERDGYVPRYENGKGLTMVPPYSISSTVVQEYDSTDSGTSWTKPDNLVYANVIVQGAGGGGGGVSASDSTAAGGGAGAHAIKTYLADDLPSTVLMTIRAGGAGGAAAGGGDGGSPSTTTFGALLTVNGGDGGTGDAGVATVGLAGGPGGVAGTGGTINGGGQDGAENSNIPSAGGYSGKGGNSYLGTGGAARNGNSPGVAGTRGAGGSGASSLASTDRAGGAGGTAYIIVEEFLA